MTTITRDAIEASYSLACKIKENELKKADAIDILEKDFNMNNASATYYLNALEKMFTGDVYQQTINIEATRYFLKSIYKDFGAETFAKAIAACEQHLDYYDSNSEGKQRKIRQLIETYKELYHLNNNKLADLNLVGDEVRNDYLENYKWREFTLSEEFKHRFRSAYSGASAGQTDQQRNSLSFGRYTCRIITPNKLTVDFPNQWFEMANYFVPYIREGEKYQKIAHEAFADTGLPRSKRKDFFEAIRNQESNWEQELEQKFPNSKGKFISSLQEELPNPADQDKIIKFLTHKEWSHSNKNVDRGDYLDSALLNLMNVVSVSQEKITEIVRCIANDSVLTELLKQAIENQNEKDSSEGTADVAFRDNDTPGINLIAYGAPGSGKSFYIDQLTNDTVSFRTIFHPEYQNSDFVGSLRPVTDEDGEISYSFVPGPFTNALLSATDNPDKAVFLIIEEINRANASAVFGEIFQLLDRENGHSQYSITPDLTWQEHLKNKGYKTPDTVRIPENLHILATMNSSDQGVFQLDTAFKRRWEFHYCPIDFARHADKNSFSQKIVPYKNELYTWTDFATAINETLKSKGIEEDRLIGPFFLGDHERQNSETCKKSISGKLLIYLWDDVLRHNRKGFFKEGINTFSDLVKAYNDNEIIFHQSVEKLFPIAESDELEALKETDQAATA